MSALDIYKTTLEAQLSSSGVFTEPAEITIDDETIVIYGIFDDTKIRSQGGGGHVQQKKSGPRFIVSEFNYHIDVYDDFEIILTDREMTFIIDEIERDAQGAAVIWLK